MQIQIQKEFPFKGDPDEAGNPTLSLTIHILLNICTISGHFLLLCGAKSTMQNSYMVFLCLVFGHLQ